MWWLWRITAVRVTRGAQNAIDTMAFNNRSKARKRVAKIHQNISTHHKDWLHKHAFGIVRQFDVVCIEDLNSKGLVKPKLAKSFSDAALSTFMQMLIGMDTLSHDMINT